MENERSRWTGWVIAAAIAGAFAISLWVLWPIIHQAAAGAGSPRAMFAMVVRISLICGLCGGLAAYVVCSALDRRWRAGWGVGLLVAFLVGVTAINLSVAGWTRVIVTAGRTHNWQNRIARYGVANPSFLQYRDGVRQDHIAYQNELTLLEYPRFLAPAALATADGRETAHSRIILARGLVAKYQALYTVRMTDLKDGLGKDKADGERKLMAMAPEFTVRLAWWKATDRIMAEQQATMDDLTLCKGRWQVKENVILFSAESDAETFDVHVAAIKALQAEAHRLDLAIAHESDKANEAMFGVRVSTVTEPRVPKN